MSGSPDPITLELYRHRFSGVAEEMGVTLRRTAYSPNIKERLDFSCALFDADGRLLAQAAHIPAHLGAMPASVRTVLGHVAHWAPGDVVIVNDPFAGGNHLPDITMVSPVFLEGESQAAFFVASRAHHADVGGMTPGSLPLSTEIYQEGVIIPPVKLYNGGVCNEALLALILRNVRTPDERAGDLAAQRAAHAIGERRLHELVSAHGRSEVLAYAAHLLAYSERLTRTALATWPQGSWRFEDLLELVDGEEIVFAPIVVTATVRHRDVAGLIGGEVEFDFSGSSPVTQSSLNAVIAITQSACYYVVRCLTSEDAPMNEGCLTPIQVLAPAGTIVNATPPAAVAGGNVETSQRMTDVVLGALAQALPAAAAAASQGTMNNLTIGGLRAQNGLQMPFAYYETIGGGMGATAQGPGLSGVQVHMTNTLNTPIEALEMSYPFRVERYALRSGSGGTGAHRGGEGIVRSYLFLAPATVTMLSERRAVAPWGIHGGAPGAVGRNRLVRAQTQPGAPAEELLHGKFTRRVAPGDRLIIETPGGGGYGAPAAASPANTPSERLP
jgi:N-methylhydantoinase B